MLNIKELSQMTPFSKLAFNPLPETFLTGLLMSEEDQKSFSFIDLYAMINPSVVNLQNLKYIKHSNDLIRKMQFSNNKEDYNLLIRSEIKDFEEEYNRDMMQMFSSTVYEINSLFSTYLIALKDNPHYASSFSAEFLKVFLSFIQLEIITIEGFNLNTINDIIEKNSYNEESIKESIQTINKEAFELEQTGDTLQSELFINSSAILEQYFTYKYVEYLEDELIKMNRSSTTVTDIIWKGNAVELAQLVYLLYGAELLTNSDNKVTKLVHQIAELLNFEMGTSWQSTLSRAIGDINSKDEVRFIERLRAGLERMRRSRMK